MFIQKGKEAGDCNGLCLRVPKKTRPLNLANVDCKIISCMVSLVLVAICSACIGTAQFGGMKGLQMIDHTFSMEAKIEEFVVCSFPNSAFLLVISPPPLIRFRGDISFVSSSLCVSPESYI